MTTGRLMSCCKRVCERMGARTVVRWAVTGVATMTVASICGGDVAHAISIGPSMKIGGMRGGFGGIATRTRTWSSVPTGITRDGPGRIGTSAGTRPPLPLGTTRDGPRGIGVQPPVPVRSIGRPGRIFGPGLGLGIGPGVVIGAMPPVGSRPPYEGTAVTPSTPSARVGGPDSRSPGTGRSARRGGSGVPPAGERRYVPDEVIVELSGNPTDQTFAGMEARHRLARLETQRIGLTNSIWVRWHIPDGRSVPAVIRRLEADNAVLSAQPNYLFALLQQNPAAPQNNGQPEAQPTGQGDSAQYALAKLHLPEAHAMARGKRVVVAVIDTEIDKTHTELSGAITDSYDALGITAPMEAHGTGIAGTIAARAKLLGAAPAVSVLAIRAFSGGSGTTMTIGKGVDYAVDHGARIINMSFAGPADPDLTRALEAAHTKGRILIAAVGNKGPKSPALFPAADPNVIAVTATDSRDQLFDGANRGGHIAIAAPGVDIFVPTPGNRYDMLTGTSFASAFVSGVAALLVERKPDLTPDAARKVLMSTAHQLGPKGRDAQFGAGLVDADQAVRSVGGSAPAELARGAWR